MGSSVTVRPNRIQPPGEDPAPGGPSRVGLGDGRWRPLTGQFAWARSFRSCSRRDPGARQLDQLQAFHPLSHPEDDRQMQAW